MIWFKSCPRCHFGDITLDEDGDRLCLQCGYIQHAIAAPAGTRLTGLRQISRSQTNHMKSYEQRREAAVIF